VCEVKHASLDERRILPQHRRKRRDACTFGQQSEERWEPV
jgi:hypothetical protein